MSTFENNGRYFLKILVNKQILPFMLWVLAIYTYISSFMQIQQTVEDLEGFKKNEL